MDLNLVSVAELVATGAFLVALVLLLTARFRPRGAFALPARLALAACLALGTFVGLSNTLEHGHVTDVLDRGYEDHLEVLFTPFLIYFFYATATSAELRKRERAERFLRQEVDMLGAVVDVSPFGILVTDAGGKVAFANELAAELLGLSWEDALDGERSRIRWVRVSSEGEERPFEDAIERGTSVRDDGYLVTRPDGGHCLLHMSVVPVLGENGKVTGVVAMVRPSDAPSEGRTAV